MSNRIFCSYARLRGIGWFMGWFLVGINFDYEDWGGYTSEFAHCKLMLIAIEHQGPLPECFYFIPKGMKVLIYLP